jgi:hypothetical protein
MSVHPFFVVISGQLLRADGEVQTLGRARLGRAEKANPEFD